MPLTQGQKLAAYEIISALGAGGMGEVYRARDTRLGRDVALKVLPPDVTNEPGRLERFDREARAIAALNHPHIVTIFSTEEADGIRFLTMELVDGHTLSELVVPSGMAITRFLDIAIPLADALVAAHQKQITHRDLKPGNVMISHDGRVKVLDFGLARVGGGDAGEHSLAATAAPITHQGIIVGTMPYMSPEQVEGRTLDARSDLFSLGVIFYELLSGDRPFKGSSSPALMSAILRDTPSSVADERPELPEALARLISRLLEKRPDDRVQTARDVFNELRHIKAGRSPEVQRKFSDRLTTGNLKVAVLPFEARTTDDEAQQLADGLRDEVANGLARFGYLRIVAGGSGAPQARYSIGGQVRRAGASIRIGAKLVDTELGTTMWTENYDAKASDDFFAVQDRIASRIVATVGDETGVLMRSMAESLAMVPLDQLSNAELVIRFHAYAEDLRPDEHLRLRTAFEQALERDPRSAEGWACLAMLCEHEHGLGFNRLPDSRQRHRQAAERAVSLNPRSQQAWSAMATVHLFARDRAGVRAATDRVAELNPLNADLVVRTALFLGLAGDPERALALTNEAIARKPHHSGWYHFVPFNFYYAQADDEAALQEAKLFSMPKMPAAQLSAAAVAGQLGLHAEARVAVDAVRAIDPALATPEAARQLWTAFILDEPYLDRLVDGFTKALSLCDQTVTPPARVLPSKPPSSTSGTSSQSGAPSVAVLPFVARSSDDESKAMAEGLTDDIILGLSRFGYLRVLSRQASSANARYTLSGQVRKAGSVWRISATLADTESGANIWAEHYDRASSATPFAVQDEVASSMVATIGDYSGVLGRASAAALADRPVEQLTVPELIARYQAYCEQFHPEEHARLRDGFERALAHEPRSAEGWASLAFLYEQEYSSQLNPLPEPLARQRRAAARAVGLDPRSQLAWAALASTHLFERDREALHGAVDRAIGINPLNADIAAECAVLLASAGEYDRAETLIRTALTLKSQPQGWYQFPLFNVHFARHEHEDALHAIKLVNIPMSRNAHVAAAAVTGHLGLAAESRLALDALRAIDPQLLDPASARHAWAVWMWDESFLDHIEDGFRKALALAKVHSSAAAPAKPPSSTSGSGSPRSGGLSVAVLPFVPRSSDEESKALAEGLTDEITAGLSKFGYLRVLSRTIAERLAREHAQVHTQARYAVEGQVRKSGAQVRVGVTLVDTETGTNLWTQGYDRDIGPDTFAIQDDVASSAVATIGDQTGVLVRAIAASIAEKPLDELTIAEIIVRYHIYTESFHPEAHGRLREAFERRLEREPRSADGWACLAMLYEQEHGFRFNPLPDALGRQHRAATRAVELDPRSQQAWIAMASVHGFARDREALKVAVERAVAINPLNADMVALSAIFLSLAGEHDRSAALARQAAERKPQHPGWYHYPMFHYYFNRGEYDAALREIKSVNMPQMPLASLGAAAVSGHLGRATEAKAAFAGLRAINPGLAEPAGARAFWSVWLWDDAFIEKLLDGFERAKELADDRSGARSDVRSGIRSDDRSIAVLPFADLSEKKDQDWFCDGIAEEILNALAQLPGLRVAARASAFSFRGKADDLEVIGEKLNVATVLEGSVRRAGDRVRITTQLSDTREGRQLWSERFDRELKDIFDVQEEIARAIADRLRISITGGLRIVEHVTDNLEAYVQLLKGREFVTRRGRAILDAIPCFEHALELDPNLAEAHALLADCYRLLGLYGIARASEVMPKAQASVDRAMAIDPNQPEALATTAIIASVYEWNLGEVRRRSNRVLAVDPSHVRALAERAISVACLEPKGTGWHQEVIEHIARARALDPLNAWVMAIESTCQMLIGRVAEAVQTAKRAVELDDKNFTAHWMHVCTLSEAGREDEALEAAVPALAMSGRHPIILTMMAAIYSDRGEQDKVEAIHAELNERAAKGFIGNAALAIVAASAGRWPEARDYLAKATAEHDPYVAFWKLPAFKPIWKDDQCGAMLKTTSLFQRTSA